MNVTMFRPDSVHDSSERKYSHATRMGDFIYVSGQVALDVNGVLVGKDDINAQGEQVFTNLQNVLTSAGTDLSRVGKLTIYVTDVAYAPSLREIRSRVFADTGITPAVTLLVVKGLVDPDFLVEIEAVAIAGQA